MGKIINTFSRIYMVNRNDSRKKLNNTTTLMDNIVGENTKSLISNTDMLKMLKVIERHMHSLSSIMSTPGPEKRPVFTKMDERKFIDSTGIPFNDVTKAISKCKMIAKHFITQNNEFYILSSILVSYFYRNKTIYKKIEVGKLINLYMALRIYKTAFSAFFKNYLPNKEVMDATIEGLDSNRYSLKKYKTIYNTIVYIADSHYENFEDILKNPVDDNIIYYITDLSTRIRLMMRKISNLYYENHQLGVKQGTDVIEIENQEGETYLNEVDNVTTLVTVNSRKIFMVFISDSVCNPKLLRSACKSTKVSFSKTTMTINKMISSRDDDIELLITKILAYFYTNGGKQLKSTKFISMMYDVYSVSNTSDKIILEIKEILDKLLKKFSKTYLETNNVATLSVLKKTLFLYMIFFIVDVM